ncbi:hypothetical protein V497_05496 [Pseudogymnoascus sp. VKM F-4516 (FW-969)]|nr:hypothetical protein V497_05496 [Pseudogymnoascus sp. VKM F-4516 (FW-969)]
MADPVGAGAGIVGVIGLVIQVTHVVVQFGMDWKNAPDDVKSFMAELGALKTVLSETNTNILLNADFAAAFQDQPSVLLSQLGPGSPSTTDTKRLLDICEGKLESLLKELKKRGEGHQLGWGRFKSAFLAKDTRDSVENLCRQCQLLNRMLSIDAAMLGASTYKEVKEARQEQREWHEAEEKISVIIRGGVDESNFRQENQARKQKKQAILDWLTPIEYASQQSDFISRRQAGTGQWLLDSSEFQAWLAAGKQTLFCPGIPGSGKTILTSIVVEKLIDQFCNSDEDVGIAYLYCNFRRRDEQKIKDLLASLVKQLAQGLNPLPDAVNSLYGKYTGTRTQPTLDELSQALEAIATLYTRVFIIVDALDECLITGSHRSDFLSRIFNVKEKSGANLFMTSRHIPEITEIFHGSTFLEIRALESDVRRYLDSNISNLPSFVRRSPDLQEEIKTGIVGAVDGMFLLARLHLDSLNGKRSPKAVRTALKSLPSGSNAYDDAYKDAMIRIEGQLLDQKDLAWQVLSWITCAKRPLTMSELQHALAIELGEISLDEDNLPQIEDMVSVCAGLVTVDEESEIIRLVHYTTQEYFERTKETWFPNLEAEITKICVTYLSFDTFGSGICHNIENLLERQRSNELYNYASCNWGHHAREACTSIPEVHSFLERDAQVQASIQVLTVGKVRFIGGSVYSRVFPRGWTGLHLAAHFGIEKTVQHLLGTTITDVKDGRGRTPLSHAAENGHKAVAKLLLANNGEINLPDNRQGQTPLAWAAGNGQEAMVKLLLANNANIELKCRSFGRTPLLWAVINGTETITRILLESGAKINSQDNSGRTALSWAAGMGYEAVFKVLLEKGADIDIKDDYTRAPLWYAAHRGNGLILRLLLVDSAEINLRDSLMGWTPLLSATAHGHEAAVRLLLLHNAEVDIEDTRDRTVISHAAENGHEPIVKLLLAHHAKVNIEDKWGRTPLLYAVRGDHEAVVKLLLEHGAKIDLKDTSHEQTALSLAELKENEAVVKLLALAELKEHVALVKPRQMHKPKPKATTDAQE